MSILDERNAELGIIEGRFIRKVLDDQAKEILQDSKRVQRQNGFKSAKWNNVNMNIGDETLTYSHPSVLRFVDMKTRKAKGYLKATKKMVAGKKKKKNFPVHNIPIMSHKRHIIRMLSFGFTEEMKNSFRNLRDYAE